MLPLYALPSACVAPCALASGVQATDLGIGVWCVCVQVPALIYPFLGSSRQGAVGPMSIPCLLVGAAVNKLEPQSDEEAVRAALSPGHRCKRCVGGVLSPHWHLLSAGGYSNWYHAACGTALPAHGQLEAWVYCAIHFQPCTLLLHVATSSRNAAAESLTLHRIAVCCCWGRCWLALRPLRPV